ncbi:MAG TPA: phage portal protein [Bacillota bacterium]|nr:phage portal protein [Bacillota bacterium]
MSWLQRVFSRRRGETVMRVKLITEEGGWYRAWDGSLYQSDIVRSAIRPKSKAIGKLTAMHIRETAGELKVNPEPYMRMLLEEPNPYSGGQMFRERLATLVQLNNNAFAQIIRDQDGLPAQMYIIPAVTAEATVTDDGQLWMRFRLSNGKALELPYSDVIHIRDDYADHDVFGMPKAEALRALLEVINATDQSIVQAVKRSAFIRWLLKFRQQLRADDIKKFVEDFSRDYLSLENETGILPQDGRFEVEPLRDGGQQFVPPSPLQQRAVERIYSFFRVNEAIVQAKYDENQWLAYYEAEIAPLAQQMSEEFTRKLFSRRERGFGNRIVFDATALTFASMRTKLGLVQMVDRGALTPNEWRRILNLPPIEGGDQPIRRLDTDVVSDWAERGGGGE